MVADVDSEMPAKDSNSITRPTITLLSWHSVFGRRDGKYSIECLVILFERKSLLSWQQWEFIIFYDETEKVVDKEVEVDLPDENDEFADEEDAIAN